MTAQAYIVAAARTAGGRRGGHVLSAAQVMAHCSDRLAVFKVPKRVILSDSLPKNASGKILKRDLRMLHREAT